MIAVNDEGDLGMCPYLARYKELTDLPTYDPEGSCFQMSICKSAGEPQCVTCEPSGGWPSVRRALGPELAVCCADCDAVIGWAASGTPDLPPIRCNDCDDRRFIAAGRSRVTPAAALWESCDRCNYERHICPGCGDNLPHHKDTCDTCIHLYGLSQTDGSGSKA